MTSPLLERVRRALRRAPRRVPRRASKLPVMSLPVMTLRRRIVIAFVALVTIAITLVGGISYSATVATFHNELDNSLVAAATTLASGGALPDPAVGPPRHQAPGGPRDPRDPGASPRDLDDGVIGLVLRLAPDGSMSILRGPIQASTPTAADLALAESGKAGAGEFDGHRIGGVNFRTYTMSLGHGLGAIIVGRDMAGTGRVLRSIGVNTILIGLGVILLAALVGWWIAAQITRRLGALTDAAEGIARTGDLTAPITITGRDEVARLATSLQTMLGQLAQARDAQRRLIEDAGHELRTPLTSLRTNAQVMRRFERLGDADRERLLTDVDRELGELTALVNELVELATDTHAGEPAGRRRLGDLVDSVAAGARRRSRREILVTADDSERVVQARAVERAIGNLLENAVKFDPDGTAPIEVTVAAGVIVVSDRGPGVPAEELPAIFERFHRSAASRSLPGSGLGLAIVREIARRHAGTVVAANRPGGGLAVTLALGDHLLPNSENP